MMEEMEEKQWLRMKNVDKHLKVVKSIYRIQFNLDHLKITLSEAFIIVLSLKLIK